MQANHWKIKYFDVFSSEIVDGSYNYLVHYKLKRSNFLVTEVIETSSNVYLI